MPSRSQQLIAAAAVVLTCALPAQAERLRVVSQITWDRSANWFGGMSGMEIDNEGRVITVISDRNSLLTAELVREGDRITGILNGPRRVISQADGKPLNKRSRDPEGLAIAPDGTAYVSFEARHRVARLNIRTGRTTDLPRHPDFDTFKINNGLEALAVNSDGTLYTLPEKTASRRTPFPVYTFDGTDWRIAHHIPRRGPFLAVGADFDDAGNFYLLERALSPLGFRSRIRRFDFSAPDLAEVTLMTSLPSQYDNLESLAVWRDDAGATRLTAISDDNFLPIQRTQIVEFRLTD